MRASSGVRTATRVPSELATDATTVHAIEAPQNRRSLTRVAAGWLHGERG